MIDILYRDRYLLLKLAEYGVISNKTINMIYSNNKQYPRRRRKKLADEKYIIKNNKYSWLGPAGKKYLHDELGINEFRGIVYDKFGRERIGKMSQVFLPLEKKYDIIPSWILKSSGSMNERKYKYYGKIISKFNNASYYIYNLGKTNNTKYVNTVIKKKGSIKYIQEEISTEVKNNSIDKVIFLVEDKKTLEIYDNIRKSLFLKEQLVIPFTNFGLKLIDFMANHDINREVVSLFYNKYTESKDSCFDFISGNEKIVCLITNDIEKIISLETYLSVTSFNLIDSTVVIIVLKSQFKKFSNEFSRFNNIKIKYVPDNIIYK